MHNRTILKIPLIISDTKFQAISSSVFSDSYTKYGPEFAIDNYLSSTKDKMFISKNEEFPWFQWKFSKKHRYVAAVAIDFYKECIGSESKHVMVRLGMDPLNADARGKININKICGNQPAHQPERGEYITFMCGKAIKARYMTVQVDDHCTLAINEINLLGKMSF